eukprot:2085576-Rhodomonas_salina.1
MCIRDRAYGTALWMRGTVRQICLVLAYGARGTVLHVCYALSGTDMRSIWCCTVLRVYYGRCLVVLTLETPYYQVGTIQYLAPEVLRRQVGSTASDVYALAVLACEAATGVEPYSDRQLPVALAHTVLAPFLPPVTSAVPVTSTVTCAVARDECRDECRARTQVLDASYNQQSLIAAICAEDLRPVLPARSPDRFSHLLARAWHVSPPQRPSASELAAALELELRTTHNVSADD